MGRGPKDCLSLLAHTKLNIFCAYDRDYSMFKARLYERNLFSHLGFKDIKKCVFMNQIHSNRVKIYDENLTDLSCDGLISKEKNTALCVLSADCPPLLLWYEDGIIAALHSGRRGSFGNILKECIHVLRTYDLTLQMHKLHLFILPSICAKNYELDGQSLDFAKMQFREFLHGRRLDLKALIKFQAHQLGIENIIDSNICNFDDTNFFSYRRDKTSKRFVSVIYLKDESCMKKRT